MLMFQIGMFYVYLLGKYLISIEDVKGGIINNQKKKKKKTKTY